MKSKNWLLVTAARALITIGIFSGFMPMARAGEGDLALSTQGGSEVATIGAHKFTLKVDAARFSLGNPRDTDELLRGDDKDKAANLLLMKPKTPGSDFESWKKLDTEASMRAYGGKDPRVVLSKEGQAKIKSGHMLDYILIRANYGRTDIDLLFLFWRDGDRFYRFRLANDRVFSIKLIDEKDQFVETVKKVLDGIELGIPLG
jgi:hypothetical protein